MADRRVISPRQLAASMYIPEENQQFQDLQNDPEYRQKLIDAALQASMVIPVGGAIAGSAQAAKAVPGMVGRASQYARGLETAAGGISPIEMAVIQAKYPGRFINPQTGFPQSVAGNVLTGRSEPAMGAVNNAFEALNPQAISYLTRPRPVVNPETGYQLQQIMPGNKFGPGITEFTMGQRAARTGVAAAPYLAAGSLAPYLAPNAMPSPEAVPVGSGRGSVIEQPGERYASDVGPGRGMVVEQPGERYAVDAGAGRGFVNEGAGERAAYEKAQAIDAAKRMAAIQATGNTAGLPPARPRENGLASLFSNPISTRELFNRAEANPDDSGAYMRAERQYAATHRDAPSVDLSKLDPDTGMKRGGAANGKPDKNEAIHRALDIISHLVGHRR